MGSGLWPHTQTANPACERESIMISNERPVPSGGRQQPSTAPKTAGPEETLRTEKLQVERKTFIFTLKENPRGRFLRITEDVGGRRDTIIIPATGLEDFLEVMEDMLDTSEGQSAEAPPAPEMFEN